MRNFYLSILFTLLLVIAGCSGQRTVTMNSSLPAAITFPSSVEGILVVDRTKFDKKAVNIIEGVMTGELPQEDKAGVQMLISSFQNKMRETSRFYVKVASERLKGNSLTSAFPDQLSWSVVDQLCKKYDTDVLLAVEIFDTDFVVTNGKRKVTKKVKDGDSTKEIEVEEFYASGVGNTTIGIRLYDPIEKSTIDQQLYRKTNTWENAAANKAEALAKLITKSDATKELSRNVAIDYVFRIAPRTVRITRSFRGKSKKVPALEQGTRYADVADWKQAAQIWESGLPHAPTKEAGYLAYNIAIAKEVLGDFDAAIDWAQRSYVQYGNKDGRSYVSLLKRRIRNENMVEEQLK